MTLDPAAARKSSDPRNPPERMAGVENLHSGENMLRVDTRIPPPEAEIPPRMIWYMREFLMRGLGWMLHAATAPEMGNDRVRPSIRGTMVSKVSEVGW